MCIAATSARRLRNRRNASLRERMLNITRRARLVNPRDPLVAVRRHDIVLSRNPLIRYDPQCQPCGREGTPATVQPRKRVVTFHATLILEKNLMTNILKVGIAAAVLALGAGCTDLKPLQAEVDSLKSQVSKLSGDVDGVKSAADGASRAAAAAQQAATSAQNSANQALSAAQAAQQCCDANSAKMDRMFEKSMSK
jgi:outer membrane murein-binding lipoprotein Lpp